MNKLSLFFKLTAIVTAIMAYIYYMATPREMDTTFFENFPEVKSYKLIHNEPLVYGVTFKNGGDGYLVFESEYGYQSNIDMAVLIDDTGNIIHTIPYWENETKVFFERLYRNSFFKNNFQSVAIENGFSINTNVDAVTGATVSSNAVAKAIHYGSSFVGEKYLDIDTPNLYETFQFGMVELVILGMFVMVFFAHFTGNRYLKILTLFYSFVLLGLEFNQFISYSTFISFATFHLPDIHENIRWYLLFIGSLTLVMFTGKNFYCTTICPFGALQQMEYKFAGLGFFKIRHSIKTFFKVFPGIIAWLAFVTVMLSKNISAANYEPFALVFGRAGINVHWVMLPITIFMALVMGRYYCTFGCPVGFVWKLLLKLRLNARRIMWKNHSTE